MGEQPEPFPGVFPGTIQAAPDLPRLVASSDLICLGSVADVSDVGDATYLVGSAVVSFRRLDATVIPERSYKGPLPDAPMHVEVLQVDAPSSLVRLEKGERAVLFLGRRGERYHLVDPSTAKIVIDRPDKQIRTALADARANPDQRVAEIARELLSELHP